MSNFFDKSDLSRKDVDEIVSETLKNCDDGEIYFENSKSESILLDDNKIKSSNYSSDLGFGFRAISNEVVAYSHSNEISKNALKETIIMKFQRVIINFMMILILLNKKH